MGGCSEEVFCRPSTAPVAAASCTLIMSIMGTLSGIFFRRVHYTMWCGRVHCVVYRGVELSREQVCQWYENRACEIEQLSGQVDGALQLVKLAIDKSVEVGCGSLISYTELFSVMFITAINSTYISGYLRSPGTTVRTWTDLVHHAFFVATLLVRNSLSPLFQLIDSYRDFPRC